MFCGGSGPGGSEDVAVVCSFLPAIQSASGTGFKTVFLGEEKPLLTPVELLRGGITLGGWKLSETIVTRDSFQSGYQR